MGGGRPNVRRVRHDDQMGVMGGLPTSVPHEGLRLEMALMT